jgi:hypothetical protein
MQTSINRYFVRRFPVSWGSLGVVPPPEWTPTGELMAKAAQVVKLIPWSAWACGEHNTGRQPGYVIVLPGAVIVRVFGGDKGKYAGWTWTAICFLVPGRENTYRGTAICTPADAARADDSYEQYVTGILQNGKLEGSWLSPDRVGKPVDTAKGLETFSIPVVTRKK